MVFKMYDLKQNENENRKINIKYHIDVLILEPKIDQDKSIEFRKRYIAYFLLCSLLFIISITFLTIQQNKMIGFYLNDINDSIASYNYTCNLLEYSTINIIMQPFSFILIIIYMFLFWRRSCCLKCLWRRPAAPMIVHPFKKNNRFFTAAVYGAISFEVVEIVSNAIIGLSVSDIFSKLVKDPSGLFKLTIRIIEVFLAALRYYPPLIAFCVDSIFIYVTSAIYMIVDLGSNIFIEGSCSGYINFGLDGAKYLKHDLVIFVIIRDIPQFFILSLLTSVLIVRSILKIVEMIKNPKKRLLLDEKIKFFSIHDLKYCIDLYNRRENNIKKSFFRRVIYDWNPNFKFSSRIINSHIVAILVLYYTFLDFMFAGIFLVKILINSINFYFTNINQFLKLLSLNLSLNTQIFYLNTFIAIFVSATILSFVICNIQVFLGLRSIQQNLLNLYKGNRNNIPLLTNNSSVSSGNTHFSGALVGFLINGFIFIFIFSFVVFIIAYFFIVFVTFAKILDIFLGFLPVIVVFIVKKIFNFVCSRILFLQQRAKILALDNFRAYSIFIYINFFFDCFIGVFSALIRLVIGTLGSLFFMPRVGYSFLGRQIENYDNGFRVSTGYYQMEYTHSHPVLLIFCALVYYKRLINKNDENISNDILYSIIHKKKCAKNRVNHDKKKEDASMDIVKDYFEEKKTKAKVGEINPKSKRFYCQRIVNKWLLIVTLINNNSLIFYRKKEYSFRKFMFLKSESLLIDDLDEELIIKF